MPDDYKKNVSVALENPPVNAAVHKVFADGVSANPGRSGFLLLPSGKDAFRMRDDLLTVADKTIDAQYYIWEIDQTGKLLIDDLVRAADRGVRVRLLLDDLTTEDLDLGLAHLDNLPNVEVRVFNAFANRDLRAIDFVADFGRINHRMHNKSLIVDNTAAIIGGRNIGNHYFGVDTVFNYRDLDLLAVGPAVPQLSDVFDRFWNSDEAVPISAFIEAPPPIEETNERKEALHQWVEAGADDYPYHQPDDRFASLKALEASRENLIWPSYYEVLADDPDKGDSDEESEFLTRGQLLREKYEKEVLIEAAFFVPGEEGMNIYRDLSARGVQIRVLTNSLASNDVIAAHGGYSNYREPLLEAGVELYELRADMPTAKRHWSLIAANSRATLHTKAMVADRQWVFIGSFNADPRSRELNTEVGLLIHDPVLGGQVADLIENGMEPQNSYALELERNGDDSDQLVWVDETDGKTVRHDRTPQAPLWLDWTAELMSMLPIEDLL